MLIKIALQKDVDGISVFMRLTETIPSINNIDRSQLQTHGIMTCYIDEQHFEDVSWTNGVKYVDIIGD